MIRKVISELKKYVAGRKNTEKTEVSVLNLNRIIFALEEQESVLDKIRTEIIEYEDRCHLSDDEYPACKECTNNVFGVIYGILDKYKAGGNQ